jgi:hypothetical protein
MNRVLEQFKNDSRWKDYDFNFQNFQSIFKKVFNQDFDFSKSYDHYFYSSYNDRETNNVTYKLNKFRDIYMLRKILEEILVYNKIFIIKGESHLEDWEDLLEGIFK